MRNSVEKNVRSDLWNSTEERSRLAKMMRDLLLSGRYWILRMMMIWDFVLSIWNTNTNFWKVVLFRIMKSRLFWFSARVQRWSENRGITSDFRVWQSSYKIRWNLKTTAVFCEWFQFTNGGTPTHEHSGDLESHRIHVFQVSETFGELSRHRRRLKDVPRVCTPTHEHSVDWQSQKELKCSKIFELLQVSFGSRFWVFESTLFFTISQTNVFVIF